MITNKDKALAKYLNKQPKELTDIDKDQYLVLTDEEADKTARKGVIDALYDFHYKVIAPESPSIMALGENRYNKLRSLGSYVNPILHIMISDIQKFINDCLYEDTRGHYIAKYDGYEYYVKVGNRKYFIYRMK